MAHESPEPTLPPEALLIRLPVVQAMTSLSESTVNRLVAMRQIWGVVKVGRCLRFDRSLVEKWIRAGCPKSEGPRK